MVNSLMYCSEQIVIPDSFPNILKNFAKAAIRTQPYDLLRWSAAYFRCLANNEPPPAKCRLEMNLQCGVLTKGYLRVLLDQVGKGFFISREILQRKWEGLCLPEDELLKYLSLCRMLNWPQIHWLRVFAVMVGSINESPTNSMVMLCEMLTEDAEGGPARIPMWMFRTVYTYLAELDCSEEQTFVNGCKMLDDGRYEPETVMDHAPKVISTTSLKEYIMNECVQRYKDEYQRDRSVSLSSGRSASSSLTSSGFEFIGKLGDTKQIAGKYGDFESLIVMLKETQEDESHVYKGPYHISQANIEYAKRREAKVDEEREKYASRQEDNANNYFLQESVNMLREMGPPWTWIHQFVSNNNADISYNFIEEDSIVSDETPPESSDESFDFVREKPVTSKGSDSDSHLFSTSTDDVADLIREEKGEMKASKIEEPVRCSLSGSVSNSASSFVSEKDVDLSDSESIVSYLNKDEMGVLLRCGEEAPSNFRIDVLDQVLRTALQNGKIFKSMDEVVDFAKIKLGEFGDGDQVDTLQSDHNTQFAGNTPRDQEVIENQEMDKNIKAEVAATIPSSTDFKENMENLLNDCGMEVDLKIAAKNVSDIMILGLAEKKDREDNGEVEDNGSETPKSTIDTTQCASSRGGYLSDSSGNEISTPVIGAQGALITDDICGVTNNNEPRYEKRPPYECSIPPFPGIGKSVSKKTIQDFLTYLKFRSRSQKGMVCPRNFREDKCPKMFD